jgi:hypothetical protein
MARGVLFFYRADLCTQLVLCCKLSRFTHSFYKRYFFVFPGWPLISS